MAMFLIPFASSCLLPFAPCLDEVTDLIAKLRATSDFSERYQLQYQIERIIKPAHLGILVKEVDTGPDALRLHFIRILRAIGGKEAAQALRGIVVKYDWASRGEAAYMLKLLNDDAGMKYIAAEFPKPAMTKDDRLKVVQYLFSYYNDTAEAKAALRKVLEAETDKILAGRIIDAIVSHRDPEALPILRKLAKAGSYDAVAALIRLGDPAALEEALQAIEGAKVPTDSIYKLMNALQMSGGQGVAERLRSALEKIEDVNTRVQIIQTLAYLKDRKALPLLHKLAKESNTSLASAALDAILQMAGRSELDNLKKILENESVDIRLRAAEALLGLDDLSGLEVIRKALADPADAWRQRAVSALATSHRKETVELLLIALEDKSANVRQQALNALNSTLAALFPYNRFDLKKAGYDATSEDAVLRASAVGRIKDWWAKNSPK